MTTDNTQQNTQPNADASQQTTPQTTPPATNTQAPKFEVRNGTWMVDGKKVVLESDLIAAKRSLEQQLEEAQSAHNEAIDKVKLEASQALDQVAAANAKVIEAEKKLEQAGASGASVEELTKLKADLDAANSRATSAETNSLEFRKQVLLRTYPGRVTEEQLKDKDAAKLDAFEEALKALAASSGGGPGNYVVGGGSGGNTELTPSERARAILDRSPVYGREPQPAQTQPQQ